MKNKSAMALSELGSWKIKTKQRPMVSGGRALSANGGRSSLARRDVKPKIRAAAFAAIAQYRAAQKSRGSKMTKTGAKK